MRRNNLYLRILTICFCLANLQPASAKVWRINSTVGVHADFIQLSDAATSANVHDDDTLYVEGAVNTYSAFNLLKRLVIIGPGYFLSGADANPGLQYNPYEAKISIYMDSLSSGSVLIGLNASFLLYPDVDNLTITRCTGSIGMYGSNPNKKLTNLVVSKSYISIAIANALTENMQVINCLVYNSLNATNCINGLVRNNTFLPVSITINNCYVSNNIFLTVYTNTLVNCSIRYNIAIGNTLPAGNNNQNNVPQASLLEGTGSGDGKYRLKSGSPASNAGEPINGITPDCGAFGTADPYRLSGIPAIPTIYDLIVPASIPASATSINVTVSTRSNN